jgi:hypothetical protein
VTAPITAAEAKDAIALLVDGLCQDHSTRTTEDTLRLQAAAQTAHAFAEASAPAFYTTFLEVSGDHQPCDALCPKGQFRCSRPVDHSGPHIALASEGEGGRRDYCAAWSEVAPRVADPANEPAPVTLGHTEPAPSPVSLHVPHANRIFLFDSDHRVRTIDGTDIPTGDAEFASVVVAEYVTERQGAVTRGHYRVIKNRNGRLDVDALPKAVRSQLYGQVQL